LYFWQSKREVMRADSTMLGTPEPYEIRISTGF
jgi:hypothetical protein